MRRVSMPSFLLLLTVAGGCSIAPQHVTTPPRPSAATDAYRCAQRTLLQMGTQMQHMDPVHGALSGILHNALTINVAVTETPAGTTVDATCTRLPGKVTVGRMTECEDFLTLVKDHC